jgi:hypothetical protein
MLASAHRERGKARGGAAGVQGGESETYDPLPKALHDCGHARNPRAPMRLLYRRTHDIAGKRGERRAQVDMEVQRVR